ncbi:MAG TPA: hypothetical protein VMV72_18585 [Verrucomicrobiae bacterium]|nr:hypothetical protein [Verrucomicrobiae bacterium]
MATPRDWRKYCDELHRAIEGKPAAQSTANRMLSQFLGQDLPIIH